MSLPGFTAEASLYRSGYGYRATVKGGPAGTAQVLPQQGLDSCRRACGSMSVRCYRSCSRMLDPSLCFDGCYAAQSVCDMGCSILQV
jgi:hypothetical protein